ncbi:putative F-box protein At3g16210 [Bidens hawaiensis]|uniref:putative F-box protein At3g16210 n=1 Tax=Bidens hawaiensis TaxID=980011 RepID=UPI00404B0971
MAGMYNHVPEDLVFAILVKLPTKPLLRLRCLSKHWNRTISDHFMKSRSCRMILLPYKLPLQVMDTAAHSISDLPLPNFMNPGSEEYRHVIVGAYNGIVLIVLKDMILYNPLTGAYRTVPNPPPLESSTSIRYGFCYETSLDELKIVRLNNMIGLDQGSRWCGVFSLKKGSWSTTSRTSVRACGIIDKAGTFLNGFLYWVASRLNGYFILVALDVKEMVLSEMQLPDFGFLGTSGGRLYLLLNTSTKFELWVMNEYGVEKSWSKVMTSNSPTGFITPLLIMDVGKVIVLKVKERIQIVIYDMLKDSEDIYEMQPRTLSSIWNAHAVEYVESLISPSHLCSSII